MRLLSEKLAAVLQTVYPGVIFDTEGLVSLLIPCLAIVLIGLIVFLLLKIPQASRRFAYVSVILALIAAIAASSFFPATLMQAGGYAAEQFQQMTPTQEEAS